MGDELRHRRGHRRQRTVDRERDAVDVAVVPDDEAQVPDEATDVLPAGERVGVQHEPVQRRVLGEPAVDDGRQRLDVRHTQRFGHLDDHDACFRQHPVGDGRRGGQPGQPGDRVRTSIGGEDPHGIGQQEPDQLQYLADPGEVGHDRAAVEGAQRPQPQP